MRTGRVSAAPSRGTRRRVVTELEHGIDPASSSWCWPDQEWPTVRFAQELRTAGELVAADERRAENQTTISDAA